MSDRIKAIEITEFGGPEKLTLIERACPAPASGELRVRLTAIGINMADTYQRTGLYPVQLPAGMGNEGAGIVEAVGDDVSDIKLGDRVGFVTGQGAYAEAIILPASAVVRLPDDIEDEQAAAILLKAMTVDYLFNDTFPLNGGETVLFHAAAGGVGLIACQWSRHLDVSLIGTASTQEKCARAIHHGAAACLILESEGIADDLNAASNGGFSVIYDSVGKSTYELSLNALAPFGTLVSFGNASGPIEAVSPAALASLGSLYFTRPTLFTFLMQPGWMQKSADKIFSLMQRGILHAEINQRYRLKDVQQAHEELEGRKTIGCSIILP